jgi:hypothetical protein
MELIRSKLIILFSADLQLWVFNRATGNTIDVFDGSNNLIESVTTNCPSK